MNSVEAENERSLNALCRALQFSQGKFSLILVRCNYSSLRDRIIQQLYGQCPTPFVEIHLPESAKTLFTAIQRELEPLPPLHPSAILILNLESLTHLDQVLVSANQIRDEFPKHFQCPLVLWVNDWVLQKLIRLAPDFKNWAGSSVIDFEMAIPDLIASLRDHCDRLFATILNTGDERFPPNWAVAPPANSLRRTEVEFAINRITESGQTLDPSLQASLNFLLGQEAHAQAELTAAQRYYEESLRFWLRGVGGQQTAVGSGEAKESQGEDIGNPTQATAFLPSSPPSHPILPSPHTERAACVLVYLGLLRRSYAVLQRVAYRPACEEALGYFQRSLALFEQINRQDLVARFIIPVVEILQKLERWEELERLARKALILHKLYKDQVRQARDHGFLAEVALARSAWSEAKTQVEAALQLLDAAEQALADHDHPHPHLETSLELAHRYHYGWYLLLLAETEAKLGQLDAAIAHLEDGRDRSHPQNDPLLYIKILQTLHDFYFDQKQYRAAFHTKRFRRSIEQQYGFRAFVGALRLEPQQYLRSITPGQIEAMLAQEIAASGRQQDVDRLIARLERSDIKLTVIHGPSGVGKSSIVSAGLVPTLKDRPTASRIALPLPVNVYTDWQTVLETLLTSVSSAPLPSVPSGIVTATPPPPSPPPLTVTLQPRSPKCQPATADIHSPLANHPPSTGSIHAQNSNFQAQDSNLQAQDSNLEAPIPNIQPQTDFPTPPPSYPLTLLDHLRQLIDTNRLPVLIFDQFEEFFFVHDTIPERRAFYTFLGDCLNLPFVKVILILREDYLHYLLEFQRLTNLDIINNDILSKEIRYPLGDFTPDDARAVIQSLTTRAQFYLEDALVDELVRDLAGELGTIRPIELQIVGAQLQTAGMTTLAAYHQKGPKAKLVEAYLEDAVHDCGPENEAIARIVLFLLTNDNGTRPLKTRDDLEADLVDLGMTHDFDKLDLVLEVLVGSGLVLFIPENPADRYQLVHDYLVSFIQQQYKTGLVADLERERKQRKQAEAQLSVELQQRLITEKELGVELQQRLQAQQERLQAEQERNIAVRDRLRWARLASFFAWLLVLVLLFTPFFVTVPRFDHMLNYYMQQRIQPK